MRLRTCSTALILACPVLAGCGAGQPPSAVPTRKSEAAAFRHSPPVLASLHRQADDLLTGGPAAFSARLAGLRGYPVVVNKWASWCGPCRLEFPAFQRAAVKYGRRVAFLGLDGKDGNSVAAEFLRRYPVTYPSYVDPRETIAQTIDAAVYYPQTVFFDRRGRMVHDHTGPYETAGTLERDIRRYVLR